MNSKKTNRTTRHKRIRAKVRGTAGVPRISVFRSNKHTYVQAIDDEAGKTLFSANDAKPEVKAKKIDSAKEIGLRVAKAASEKNIKKVVFDRGGYKYHGIVKKLCEGVRKGGLNI